MPHCVQCRKYASYSNSSCRDCIHISDDSISGCEVSVRTSNSHFQRNIKRNNFSYQLIKGKTAELIVQELFVSAGYTVYKYGLENTIPELLWELKSSSDQKGNLLRKMPDFVIKRVGSNKVEFLEVKYRSNGDLKFDEEWKDYPYSDFMIVLVTKTQIKCLTYEEFKNGKSFKSPGSCICKRKDLKLDKESVSVFCSFARHFFENH